MSDFQPIDTETLTWMTAGETNADQEYIRQQVTGANQGEIRNYSIVLQNGTNFQISPGFVNVSRAFIK